MTSGDFQSKSGGNPMLNPSHSAVSSNAGPDSSAGADAGQNVIVTAQRSQAGFHSQSVDEIGRLYVEAPFSW